MSGAGGTAAAAQRRREEEEEEMTGYSAEDLAEGWEFKIVRSAVSKSRAFPSSHMNGRRRERSSAR